MTRSGAVAAVGIGFLLLAAALLLGREPGPRAPAAGREPEAETGTLVGTVREVAGDPIPGARVTAGWRCHATAAAAVEFVLERGGLPLGGSVRDEAGRPVAGAEVRIYARRDDLHWIGSLVRPVTAADGSFRWDGLPAGLYELFARARSREEVRHREPVAAGRTDLLIVLPAAGENVDHSEWCTEEDEEMLPDGGYILDGVTPGRYRISLRARGVGFVGREGIVVQAGETTEVDLRLTAGPELRGTVVSAEDGAPVAGALVIATDGDWPWLHYEDERIAWINHAVPTRTDAEGRFRLVGLGPGEWAVGARAPGYEPGAAPDRVTLPREEELPPIRLSAAATLEVVVLSGAGEPLADVDLFLSLDEAETLDGETDADGRWRTMSVPPGERWVQLWGRDGFSGVARVDVVAGRENRLVVRLPAGDAVVTSRVTRGGRPVVNARVEVEVPAADGGSFVFRAQADAAGRYEVRGLPTGAAEVRAQTDSNRPPTAPVARDLGPAETVVDVEIPAAGLRAIVTDAETGELLPLAYASYFSGESGDVAAYGRGGGEEGVRLTDLAPGTGRLVVHAEGHAAATVPATAGEDEPVVRVALRPAPATTILFRDEAGAPVTEAGWRFEDPEGNRLGWPTTETGLMDIRAGREVVRLLPGDYVVVVEDERFAPLQVPFRVGPEGGTVEVVLRAR